MTKTFLKLAIAGGVAFAVMGPINAAPVSQSERSDLRASERHEFRDAQTGDYRPHGTQLSDKEKVGKKYLGGAPAMMPVQPGLRQPGDL